MAAPKRNRTKPDNPAQARTREIIQTTQLVKRLQSYALGNDGVDIDSGRMKAIEILLRKSLPDLQSIKHEGEVGMAIYLGKDADKL